MNDLKLPKGWDTFGANNVHIPYMGVHGSGSTAVRFTFPWDQIKQYEKVYKAKCNKHRIMLRYRADVDYAPAPDDIETLQQAVDYLHVLSRMGET